MSEYKSTHETENLALEARIFLGPVTEMLREILFDIISENELKKNVQYLTNTRVIMNYQEYIIFGGDYSQFDISLLCPILKNANYLYCRKRSLQEDPQNFDIIRSLRNEWYGHVKTYYLSNTDFEKHCNEILEVVKVLEHGELVDSTRYQNSVTSIKSCGGVSDLKYIKRLLDIEKKQLENLIDMVDALAGSNFPRNVKEMNEKASIKWRKEDEIFVETEDFNTIEKQVQKQKYVMFVGAPGSGKTATVRHIALKLQRNESEVWEITDIRCIETYINPSKPQVFIIENALGLFELNKSKLNKIRECKETIENHTNEETKILFTCREAIFKNRALAKTFLAKKENVVNLNVLSDKDKYNLFSKYKLDGNVLTQIDMAKTSSMFPLLCKLYSENRGLSKYGPKFFISPIPYLLEELDDMKNENKTQYASLVFLVMSQNSLTETKLYHDSYIEIKRHFSQKGIIDSKTEPAMLYEALRELEGFYTKQVDGRFTFVHEHMFEIVAYHVGQDFPEIILQYMSSGYIASHLRPNSTHDTENEEENADLLLILNELKFPILAERLFRDLENGELYNVFRNICFQHSRMRTAFVGVLKNMSFSQLSSVFLSELKECFNLRRYTLNAGLTRDKMFDVKHQESEFHRLLLSQRTLKRRRGKAISCFYMYSVRAISWVVCVGHHETLQYVIDRTKKETGSIDILFQSSYNKGDRNYSNIKEIDTDTELKYAVDKIKQGKSYLVGNYRIQLQAREQLCESDDDTDSDWANDTENESDTDIKNNQVKYRKSKSDYEPLIAEQRRLLCLGCFSGDLKTVQILLQHTTHAVNSTESYFGKQHYELEPLIIACKLGHLDIAKELLQAGYGENVKGRYDTPLTAACAKGDLAVVEKLIGVGADVNLSVKNKTPLIEACAKGHINIVRYLIGKGADVNLEAGDNTPLTAACRENQIDVVKELINENADIDKKNSFTPLTMSCYYGHLGVIEELISAKANVNLSCNSFTPLLAACWFGDLKVVKFLIANGADVNSRIRDETPLTVACYEDHVNIIELLINKGARIDFTGETKTVLFKTQLRVTDVLEKKTDSPLIKACYFKKIRFIKKFLELGADVNSFDKKHTPLTAACSKNHLDVVELLINYSANVNLSNGEKTPLTIACAMKNVHVVNMLIKAGADVNLADNEKGTPLTTACAMDDLQVVNELIDTKKADVNLADKKKGTPLIIACSRNYLSVVQMLIEANADVNLAHGGKTPLTVSFDEGHLIVAFELITAGASVNKNFQNAIPFPIERFQKQLSLIKNLIAMNIDKDLIFRKNAFLTDACNQGLLDFVKELIEAKANVNINDGKRTPLTAACSIGYIGMVKELIEAGADVDLSDNYRTPLTAACSFEHYDIVKALIKKGAIVNLSDNYRTPLTAACSLGNLDIVELLIEESADVNLSDNFRTPLTAACSLGHGDIVKALIKANANVNLSDGYRTPLTAACYHNHSHVVSELIKAGADVNLADRKNTPLTVAYERMNMYIFDYLLRKGGEFNSSGSDTIPPRNSIVHNVLHLCERFIYEFFMIWLT